MQIHAGTTHTFCGIEGLSGEMGNVPAETLFVFYSGLQQLNLKKQ